MPIAHEPNNKMQKKIERRKILNSYMLLGYKTVPRTHPDSYVLDVINSIFARGQTGRIVEEIRTKRGLAYECNVLHDALSNYGTFAAYLSTNKKNIPLAKKIVLDEFRKITTITQTEIDDAKGFMIGKKILEQEDTHHVSDTLIFWEIIKDSSLAESYLTKIKKVTKNDIIRVAKKYLTKEYTQVLIEQK